MMHPQINIINLPNRQDRRSSILEELRQQKITNFKIWEGIVDGSSAATKISQAHKQIVRNARENNFPSVIIAEDDIHFTAPGAFRFFCEHLPAEYDIYLGAISHGNIEENNRVVDFSGLLLYQVHRRFYDTFISMPEQEYIDRALRGKGIYIVCPSFVVIEHNGKSDNTGKTGDNSIYYAGRPLFGLPPISFE